MVITGAAGFVGRAVAQRLDERPCPPDVRWVDRALPRTSAAGSRGVRADLTDAVQRDAVLAGAERVIHLAALPGGASEADPRASRAINLDASLDLIDALGATERRPRLVYASSIAVFGASVPAAVDDGTPPSPSMTYGTHKLMVEYAIADAVRRERIDGIALRLPGVVARPRGPSGLKSAFMSDIFRAVRDGGTFHVPVDADATMWLLSANACADALLHAAEMPWPANAPPVLNLPALRVTMRDLVAAIAAATGSTPSCVTYRPDPVMTAQFGRLPPLSTPAAAALGFVHDGTLDCLVERVLRSLDS